jgi:hypothetical protein
MAQKLSGGCACGAIQYECSADPVLMLNCHCRDCQKASGSAYAAIAVLPKSAVQISGDHVITKSSDRPAKLSNAGFVRIAVAK